MYKFSLIALCALVVGCATRPAPMVDELMASTPDAPSAWTTAKVAEGSIDRQWWLEFGDEKLNALVSEALEHNSTLVAASARVERVIAQAKIAGAEMSPQLSAGLSGSRQKSVFNFGGGTSSARTSTFGASLTASWEADVWGRIRAGHEAAFADVDAEMAAYEGAVLSLSTQVIRAYFIAVASRMQVMRAKQSLENAKLIERAVQNRYEAGQRPLVDVDLIAATRAGAEAAVASTERALDFALRQLETLVGRYPKASVEIAERLPKVPQEVIPAGIPADIVSRRPDLVEAERRYVGDSRRVDEAKANRYPKLSLTASAGTSSDELKDLLDRDFSVWSLAANIAAPLLDGGRLKAVVELNEANLEEKRANFVLAVLRAWQEVEVAMAADVFFHRQIVAMRENRVRSASALKLADERYAKGNSDILTVLNARQTLYQSEIDLVRVAAERLDARISLFTALGGGFDAKTIYERGDQDESKAKVSSETGADKTDSTTTKE